MILDVLRSLLSPLGYSGRRLRDGDTDQTGREGLAGKLAKVNAERLRLKRSLLATRARLDRLRGDHDRRLAELEAARTRLQQLRPSAAGAPVRHSSDEQGRFETLLGYREAADRAVSELVQDQTESEGKPLERRYFELGYELQTRGAISLACAAYRRAGPRIDEFLAQDGPNGSCISGPDFLIIGAPRAGSTWLKKRLALHPRLFLLANEQHYFSSTPSLAPDAYVRRFAGPRARYLGRRPRLAPVPASERIYGEKSPTYLSMPDCNIDLCAALYPKARLICVVREPVARAWSHIRHLGLNHRGGNLNALHNVNYWKSLDVVVGMGRYREHLVRWARRFAPEQILVVEFHRMSSEPEAVYREVARHLGVEPLPPLVDSPFRQAPAAEQAIPPILRDYLSEAYAREAFDASSLRAAMQAAAREGEPLGAQTV